MQSSYRIPVRIQGLGVTAVVDTAAEVAIISDDIFSQLASPGVIKEIRSNTAGRNQSIPSQLVGPLEVGIGTQTFHDNIYAALIADEMLLGLDFLRRHRAIINIPESFIKLGPEKIPMQDSDLAEGNIYRVCVERTVVIPPNTGKWVSCNTEGKLPVLLVEPKENVEVVMAASLHKDSLCRILMFNLSDKHIKLKHNQWIANA